MKKLYLMILLFVFLIDHPVQAQIGGLSASKLTAINSETVPQFTIEFEPSITFGFSTKHWNHTGKSELLFNNAHIFRVQSLMAFRFTYGVTKHWEMGFSVPTDVSLLCYGSKYRFWKSKKFSLALLNGFDIPLGDSVYYFGTGNQKIKSYDPHLLLGLAATWQFNDVCSVDFNPVIQAHADNGLAGLWDGMDLFINTDFGYYVRKGVQIILGFDYVNAGMGLSLDSQKLALNPGVTIEKAKNFILVLNFPWDLFGRNATQEMGVGFALTIWIT